MSIVAFKTQAFDKVEWEAMVALEGGDVVGTTSMTLTIWPKKNDSYNWVFFVSIYEEVLV